MKRFLTTLLLANLTNLILWLHPLPDPAVQATRQGTPQTETSQQDISLQDMLQATESSLSTAALR